MSSGGCWVRDEGVTWDHDKWLVMLHLGTVRMYLGTYDSRQKAEEVYAKYKKKYNV